MIDLVFAWKSLSNWHRIRVISCCLNAGSAYIRFLKAFTFQIDFNKIIPLNSFRSIHLTKNHFYWIHFGKFISPNFHFTNSFFYRIHFTEFSQLVHSELLGLRVNSFCKLILHSNRLVQSFACKPSSHSKTSQQRRKRQVKSSLNTQQITEQYWMAYPMKSFHAAPFAVDHESWVRQDDP